MRHIFGRYSLVSIPTNKAASTILCPAALAMIYCMVLSRLQAPNQVTATANNQVTATANDIVIAVAHLTIHAVANNPESRHSPRASRVIEK